MKYRYLVVGEDDFVWGTNDAIVALEVEDALVLDCKEGLNLASGKPIPEYFPPEEEEEEEEDDDE